MQKNSWLGDGKQEKCVPRNIISVHRDNKASDREKNTLFGRIFVSGGQKKLHREKI